MRIRAVGLAVYLLLMCGSRWSNADELGAVAEAVTGLEVSPRSARLWQLNIPTDLLSNDRLTLWLHTGLSDVMRRQIPSDGLHSFSSGLGGAMVIPWGSGVTAVRASGRSQDHRFADAREHISITPTPRLGTMILAHAHRRHDSRFGFSVARSTYSIRDKVMVKRYPHSKRSEPLNLLFLNLLPTAIGSPVGYDAVGDQYQLTFDAASQGSEWTLGAAAIWNRHDTDVGTEHRNSTEGSLLSGRKIGVGSFEGSEWILGGRLDWHPDETRAVRMAASWGSGDGRFGLWQVDPTYDESGRTIDTSTWLLDTLSTGRWRWSVDARWDVLQNWSVAGAAQYSITDIAIDGLAQTPVLRRESAGQEVLHRATNIRSEGDIKAWIIDIAVKKYPRKLWGIRSGVGVLGASGRVDLSADRDMSYDIEDMVRPYATQIGYRNSLIAFVDAGVSRRLTSQIVVSYDVRQYLPLKGHWTFDGTRSTDGLLAGSGNRGGSTHLAAIEMEL